MHRQVEELTLNFQIVANCSFDKDFDAEKVKLPCKTALETSSLNTNAVSDIKVTQLLLFLPTLTFVRVPIATTTKN